MLYLRLYIAPSSLLRTIFAHALCRRRRPSSCTSTRPTNRRLARRRSSRCRGILDRNYNLPQCFQGWFCAVVQASSRFIEYTADEFRSFVSTNLDGLIFITRHRRARSMLHTLDFFGHAALPLPFSPRGGQSCDRNDKIPRGYRYILTALQERHLGPEFHP